MRRELQKYSMGLMNSFMNVIKQNGFVIEPNKQWR